MVSMELLLCMSIGSTDNSKVKKMDFPILFKVENNVYYHKHKNVIKYHL